jgi:hypothetical protein
MPGLRLWTSEYVTFWLSGALGLYEKGLYERIFERPISTTGVWMFQTVAGHMERILGVSWSHFCDLGDQHWLPANNTPSSWTH